MFTRFGIYTPYWAVGIIIFLTYSPLTWVRRIQKFAKFHIFCDFVVLLAFIIIIFYAFANIAENEGISDDSQQINSDSFIVFLGTSIFVFEGVGIILPIKDICETPKDYPKIVDLVLIFLTVMFLFFSLVNYFSYGDEILSHAALATSLLPPGNVLVDIVLILFIINLVITFTLIIYPANVILEKLIFVNYKQSLKRKWMKNLSRSFLVAFVIIFSLYFENQIDKIISIVGSLC
jgi:proton-coupled amino acid transporter